MKLIQEGGGLITTKKRGQYNTKHNVSQKD